MPRRPLLDAPIRPRRRAQLGRVAEVSAGVQLERRGSLAQALPLGPDRRFWPFHARNKQLCACVVHCGNVYASALAPRHARGHCTAHLQLAHVTCSTGWSSRTQRVPGWHTPARLTRWSLWAGCSGDSGPSPCGMNPSASCDATRLRPRARPKGDSGAVVVGRMPCSALWSGTCCTAFRRCSWLVNSS